MFSKLALALAAASTAAYAAVLPRDASPIDISTLVPKSGYIVAYGNFGEGPYGTLAADGTLSSNFDAPHVFTTTASTIGTSQANVFAHLALGPGCTISETTPISCSGSASTPFVVGESNLVYEGQKTWEFWWLNPDFAFELQADGKSLLSYWSGDAGHPNTGKAVRLTIVEA